MMIKPSEHQWAVRFRCHYLVIASSFFILVKNVATENPQLWNNTDQQVHASFCNRLKSEKVFEILEEMGKERGGKPCSLQGYKKHIVQGHLLPFWIFKNKDSHIYLKNETSIKIRF